MAYLRRRNGYGYICEKVKDTRFGWKEATIVPLGKINSDEDLERMKWITKTGIKLEDGSDMDMQEGVMNDAKESEKRFARVDFKKILYTWQYAPVRFMGEIDPEELTQSHKMSEEEFDAILEKTGYSTEGITCIVDQDGYKYFW